MYTLGKNMDLIDASKLSQRIDDANRSQLRATHGGDFQQFEYNGTAKTVTAGGIVNGGLAVEIPKGEVWIPVHVRHIIKFGSVEAVTSIALYMLHPGWIWSGGAVDGFRPIPSTATPEPLQLTVGDDQTAMGATTYTFEWGAQYGSGVGQRIFHRVWYPGCTIMSQWLWAGAGTKNVVTDKLAIWYHRIPLGDKKLSESRKTHQYDELELIKNILADGLTTGLPHVEG